MNNGSMQGNHVSIGGRGGQFFHIDWQLAGQSIANNNSTINWQARFRYDIADAQLDNGSAGLSGTRWANGGRVRNFGGDYSTRSVTLASGSFTIGHNSDGTRSLSVSGGVDVFGSGRSAGSQSFNLPTIPRNSQVSTGSSAYDIGEAARIYTNRKSSSFTHTITVNLHNSSGAEVARFNSVGDSVLWTPTTSQINQMQNAIPNGKYVNIYIRSYNNQVKAASSVTRRFTITNANPTFSDFTFRDSNSAVVAITGDDQILVKGKSTLEVKVPSASKMIAIKGSDEDRYSFAYDGTSNNVDYSTGDVTSTFSNIATVGSRAVLVTAYDTRSNNTRVAKNVQVYDYTQPNIEISVSRENNFGDDVTIETGGTFDLLPINAVNKNELTAASLEYRHREKDIGTWSSWVAIDFTVTGNGFTGDDEFITFDNTKEYDLEFRIADKFGTVTQSAELGKGTPIMFVGNSGGEPAVGINKVPEQGALDVAGDIYSNGEKVATQLDYSTSEQDTGQKWIDGKTIYSRTWVLNSGSGTSYNYTHGVSIDYLVKIETSISNYTPYPTVPYDMSYSVGIYMTATNISFRRGANGTSGSFTVTGYYTKGA